MISSLDTYTDFMELTNSDVRQVQLPTGETSIITHLGSSFILDG